MRLGKGFQFELYLQGEPLIPGLPDDVALNCLLRLPVECHTACKAVCKRWHFLLGNKERFFTSRKELGFKDPWLFVLAFHKCTGEIEWQVLDLTNFSWHSIPTMPCKDNICPHGIGCVSFPSEGALFVCGGMMASDVDSPLDLVFKYEIQKNNWTVMKKMNTARSFFASGVINGMIYVAGGNSADLFELDSAEVMDPAIGNWHPVASMGTNMASYDSAVFNGKLLVTEGCVVVYGHLFVVSEHERMKLKVYYPDNDSWETTRGPPLPEQICKPFAVNAYDNIIYVVGRYLHVAMGYISKRNQTGSSENKWRFSVEWQVIDGPKLSDLTPSTSQVLFA
ncbi:hypothetical protein Godav_022686 [Gossypium davidsonii]|uniref:F-box domain-containing protein n=1 Tax=Gossypium davidsonii TaxID=34287 RepID=A0A7J8SP50_GOSDV|nr:hypothetical protein [Gossypium davidsonii]